VIEYHLDEVRKTLSDAHQAGIDFLIVDLETALTFLNTADASQQAETAQRCRRNARKAYDTVLGFAEKLELTPSERQAVDIKLKAVKGRLESSGEEF